MKTMKRSDFASRNNSAANFRSTSFAVPSQTDIAVIEHTLCVCSFFILCLISFALSLSLLALLILIAELTILRQAETGNNFTAYQD